MAEQGVEFIFYLVQLREIGLHRSHPLSDGRGGGDRGRPDPPPASSLAWMIRYIHEEVEDSLALGFSVVKGDSYLGLFAMLSKNRFDFVCQASIYILIGGAEKYGCNL